jgi:hypothetical protein
MSAFSIRVDKDKAPAMKASGWEVQEYGGEHAVMVTDDPDLFKAATQPAPPKKKKKAPRARREG